MQKKGFIVFLSTENLPQELIQNRCLALTASVRDASGFLTVKNNIELNDCYGTLLYSSKFGKSKEKEYKKAYHEAIRKAYATMDDIASTVIETREVPEKKEEVEPRPISDPSKQDFVKMETLYAQTTNSGFQLVNMQPAVVYQLLYTNLKDVYVLKGVHGIFYKKGPHWVAEYYDNNQLIHREYQVKF